MHPQRSGNSVAGCATSATCEVDVESQSSVGTTYGQEQRTAMHAFDNGTGLELGFGYPTDADRAGVVHVLFLSSARSAQEAENATCP